MRDVDAGRVAAAMVQLGLAGFLAASHAVTTAPFVYPHYVALILLHPWIVRRVTGVRLRPWLIVWISVPLFVHPIGGLYGFYADVWWYDKAAHFASATVVAGIGYVVGRAGDEHGLFPVAPRYTVAAFTMLFVMSAGVLWETVEEWTPLLTVYGPNDTFWDYVFDAAGGLTVVALGPWLLDRQASGLEEAVEDGLAGRSDDGGE